jgi:hypothetical protein
VLIYSDNGSGLENGRPIDRDSVTPARRVLSSLVQSESFLVGPGRLEVYHPR